MACPSLKVTHQPPGSSVLEWCERTMRTNGNDFTKLNRLRASAGALETQHTDMCVFVCVFVAWSQGGMIIGFTRPHRPSGSAALIRFASSRHPVLRAVRSRSVRLFLVMSQAPTQTSDRDDDDDDADGQEASSLSCAGCHAPAGVAIPNRAVGVVALASGLQTLSRDYGKRNRTHSRGHRSVEST